MKKTKIKNEHTAVKLFLRSLYGFKRYLALSSLFVLLAILATYAAPFVTSFTLDYVIQGKDANIPQFFMRIVESVGGQEFFVNNLFVCGAAYLLCTLANGGFTYLRRRNVAFAAEGMAKQLRDNLYTHLNAVPYDYHKHVNTGDIVQRCTSDVDTVRRFVSMQAMEIVRTVIMFVVALVVMFSIHTEMALISMAVLPLLTVSSFVYFRYVRKYFLESDESEGALSTAIQENLTGVRVVRAFGQQRAEYDKFTKLNKDFRTKTEKLITLLGYYWGISDAFGYIQIAVSLVAGICFNVADPEAFTLGNVTLFVTYTGMLTWPVRQLGRILADMGKASVSLGRLNEILSAEAEKEPGKALKPDMIGDIVFDRVCFGYHEYNDVLNEVSFTAHPGQTIAILGSTGSGKSSLVQLLQRLYLCTDGSITINGVNINDIDHAHLRKNIGIVLQEPFLYSRTIMENIKIVDPDAPDERVYEAAKTAAVHDVIMQFDDGYDTIVGERGVTLSGGQQQRVAIARTLMQRAPILIFDDSMSAVDTETDAQIRDALCSMKKDGITFIISHRITTLCEADNILVLDHGKIVQQGSHDELIKQDGLYRRIAVIQDMAGKEE
ncbi:MAG: ABC transporter ATP-binding protein [Clostridia bacterium]|nr:ABC transporter ATP-binding protein [Clostridia bacterium]